MRGLTVKRLTRGNWIPVTTRVLNLLPGGETYLCA